MATIEDVAALTDLRLAFLAEVSTAPAEAETRTAILEYFSQAIPAGEFVAYIAVARSRIIATSGLVTHVHPPSSFHPTGREAYIMNMYTDPAWRRRGIATKLVQMLIDHGRQNGCDRISLHTHPQGRSIYTKAGFSPIETEMRLTLQK
ncbi:MAG TPA: GNAT family N-acetyltransferase [Tepidisphaeraceae bacterium]|nr:GNAT family N-acetyltransferase [Tepidisphaeraceae bacterium]